MARTPTLRLAVPADAASIARLSRDRIEHGLGWSWTAPRVLRSICDAQTDVVVADGAAGIRGFGALKLLDDEAHLLLLAVAHDAVRRGIGSALVDWLERVAVVAGVARIGLEARLGNDAARAFYRRLGYREVRQVAGYYQGREACVRLVKELRIERAAPA